MSQRSNPLRNLLNRLRWDASVRPDDFIIAFASRGAPGGVETVRGGLVGRVCARGFEVVEGGRVRYIPFHRVLLVKNEVTGQTVYEKRRDRGVSGST